jgi:hypothetical protein
MRKFTASVQIAAKPPLRFIKPYRFFAAGSPANQQVFPGCRIGNPEGFYTKKPGIIPGFPISIF